MHTLGKRTERPLSAAASGALLQEAARFNETLQEAFPYGKFIAVRKGVYRFRSHAEANLQQDEGIAQTMALVESAMR